MTEPVGRIDAVSGDPQKDDAATALATSMWPLFAEAARDGWTLQEPGAVAYCSHSPVPIFNGVIAASRHIDPTIVDELLDKVAHAVDGFCLQVRPGSPAIEAVARARGMVVDQREPLMLLEDPARLPEATAVDGFVVSRLGVDEFDRHLALALDGFGAPIEAFAPWIGCDVLGERGVTAYVGSIGGRDVATALGIVADDHVGVFNVATPPGHRRQGFGSALTARTVLDGLASGARQALLMSSEMGLHVYQQLGFQEQELWSVWVPADVAAH
jgi:ribosomal protein S18 acetylase RimI-like enzyme